MNIIRHLSLLFALCLALFAAACEQNPTDKSEVLATVNGEAITQTDYDHYLRARQSQNGQIADKEKEKETVLGEMIDRALLVQYAVKKRVEQDEEVMMMLKRDRENILVRALLTQEFKEKPVTEEEMRRRYDEEAGKTHKSEYKVSHILYKTEEEAKETIRKLQGKASFAELAKKDSIDVHSGKKDGALGWINQGMVVPEFFNGVLALKKGQVSSEPVQSSFGFHVIKLEDSQPWTPPPFEQVKANIQRQLQNDKINNLISELKAGAKIQMRQEAAQANSE